MLEPPKSTKPQNSFFDEIVDCVSLDDESINVPKVERKKSGFDSFYELCMDPTIVRMSRMKPGILPEDYDEISDNSMDKLNDN